MRVVYDRLMIVSHITVELVPRQCTGVHANFPGAGRRLANAFAFLLQLWPKPSLVPERGATHQKRCSLVERDWKRAENT